MRFKVKSEVTVGFLVENYLRNDICLFWFTIKIAKFLGVSILFPHPVYTHINRIKNSKLQNPNAKPQLKPEGGKININDYTISY